LDVTARVEVEGARVSFGNTVALDGLDLSVARGEVVAVLGPSGSGKSTLLRAIAGLQPLDSGRVRLDGADASARPPHQRGTGMMFQQHALFPHLDVGGNVAYGLRMQGQRGPTVAARVAELLALVGLPDTERRDIATLSGGEQQRVALARALAPEPRVLLLDEPLGSLDRPRRESLVVELRRLFSRLELTVIAVTHDHAVAFALADRLLLLDRGAELQTGSPADVWRHPDTVRVAELLGFTNLAHVEVVGGRARSPWGDHGPSDRPAHRVLVRPEAVRIAPGGELEGTVVAVTFAGARARLRVEIDGAPDLEAEVSAGELPAVGTAVGLALDPAGVSLLPA
jgi:thiamine transport system ATP-binding protein